MPTADENRQREDLENQVWNAIAAFEQIVETIPTDRVSLEALSNAYEQVGDLARARDYLIRLVDVLIAEKDREAAELVRDRLVKLAATDPLAKEAATRLDALLTVGLPVPKKFDLSQEQVELDARKVEDAERRSSHVAAELSLAWALFQANELNQEEYALVAQDLSEISARNALITVSVLHVLHDRGNKSLERVLAFASRDSGVPIIPLGLFDVPDAAFTLLPVEFVVRFGVTVFALMGQDALVAQMNPFNRQMNAKVEQIVNRPCHFYLTTPADFDALLEKRKVVKPAPASASPSP